MLYSHSQRNHFHSKNLSKSKRQPLLRSREKSSPCARHVKLEYLREGKGSLARFSLFYWVNSYIEILPLEKLIIKELLVETNAQADG